MTTDPAALLARCRAALDESDRLAQAATPGPWGFGGAGVGTAYAPGVAIAKTDLTPSPCPADFDLRSEWQRSCRDGSHIGANSPARVLALNAAWRTVLDGAEQTIAEHQPECRGHPGPWLPHSPENCNMECYAPCEPEWPCTPYRRAVETVAALAAALTEGTT